MISIDRTVARYSGTGANAAVHFMQYAHVLTLCVLLCRWPFIRCFPCSALFFGACPWSVTFYDYTSERPLPDKVGVWGGGGAVGCRATREHRCTLSGGVCGAPLWGLCLACGEAGSSPHSFGACLVLSWSLWFLSLCAFLRAWDAVDSVVWPPFV